MKLLALTLCLGLCAAPALADDVAEIDTASMDEALETLELCGEVRTHLQR